MPQLAQELNSREAYMLCPAQEFDLQELVMPQPPWESAP